MKFLRFTHPCPQPKALAMTIFTLRRALPFLLSVLAITAPLALASRAHATDAAYQAALRSTGIIFDDETGGSCWVVDGQKMLGITNYHVVREKKQFKVYFPSLVQGEVQQKFAHYRDHCDLVTVTVLMTDPSHDLALLQFDHLPRGIVALPAAQREPAVGDPLFNLGYDSHAATLFVWHQTRLSKLSVPDMDIKTVGTLADPVYETKPNFRDGFSGGPVLNARGELVGVVSCSKENIGAGYIIKRAQVSELLDRSGLYGRRPAAVAEENREEPDPQPTQKHVVKRVGTPEAKRVGKPEVKQVEKRGTSVKKVPAKPAPAKTADSAPIPLKRVAKSTPTQATPARVRRVPVRVAEENEEENESAENVEEENDDEENAEPRDNFEKKVYGFLKPGAR